jgi:hypothetical protein
MKPKPINTLDTTLQSKKMSIETPIGSLESDSGSHLLDVSSIFLLAVGLYFVKAYIDNYFKKG